MLKTLKRIVQEVSGAHNLEEALNVMVVRVREAIGAGASSVFLVDPLSKQYFLMATDGLNPKAVGKVSFAEGVGLVGLVGERGEPINLDNAPSHPKFNEIKAVSEDKFSAFLGVPIIHQAQLVGVMVVQQESKRRFDESEEAFLVTVSAQLAGVIGHAKIERKKKKKWLKKEGGAEETLLMGIPSVAGVAIGEAFVVRPPALLAAVVEQEVEDTEGEKKRFFMALNKVKQDISHLKKRYENSLPEQELALFDVYLSMLAEENLGAEVTVYLDGGYSAEWSLRCAIKKHIMHFESLEDDYLRERAADFRDLGRRILSHLESEERALRCYPEKVILVGEEVTAAALVEVPEGALKGVVSGRGSSNSHVAILARALGVPTVMGTPGLPLKTLDSKTIIVDGYMGQVVIDPSDRVHGQFYALLKEEEELDKGLEALQDQPAITPDGVEVALHVNIGLVADASRALTVGASGVGLYRTELSFMNRDRFPTEEEQRVIYRQVLSAFAPRPVVMRTLDVGGGQSPALF